MEVGLGRNKLTSWLAAMWLGLWLCGVSLSAAWAEGISISKAEVRNSGNGYYLAANYKLELSETVAQALASGIPLTFISEFSMTRPRWYWLDEDVFYSKQSVKLSFNVITRQYRVSRGSLYRTFSSLEAALQALSFQTSSTLPTSLIREENEGYLAQISGMFKSKPSYIAAVRMQLDTEQLPKLIQVDALTSTDWNLGADWQRWQVDPAKIEGD